MRCPNTLQWWCSVRVKSVERCRVGRGRTESTFVLLRAWIRSCCSCSIQCEVVISPSCAVHIHYNGDSRSTFIFVAYMRCVDPGRTGCTFVLPCAWIWSCYSCSMQCEVIISPSFAVQMHYNGDGRSTFIFIEWMQRCRVDPGRTGCAFALLCARICNCYSCSMQCDVVILPSFAVQIHYNVMLGSHLSSLNEWNGFALALDEQKVRLYCCVVEFEAVICV